MKNRKIVFLIFLSILVLTIVTPVYGQESRLQKQGNITGFRDVIRNMKEDYVFLENEIFSLMEECN